MRTQEVAGMPTQPTITSVTCMITWFFKIPFRKTQIAVRAQRHVGHDASTHECPGSHLIVHPMFYLRAPSYLLTQAGPEDAEIARARSTLSRSNRGLLDAKMPPASKETEGRCDKND